MINTGINNLHDLIHLSKILVFDFDGTIANTEPLHWEAYRRCLEEIGVRLQPTDISRYIGNSELKIYDLIKHDFSINFDNGDFFRKRLDHFYKLVDETELKPFPQLISIIKQYSDTSIIVIVSSQALQVISYLLNKWEINNLFSQIISAPYENRTKEDILTNFKQYSQCENKDITFFDDLNKHVSHAISCGMKGIAVTKKEMLSDFTNCDGFIFIE